MSNSQQRDMGARIRTRRTALGLTQEELAAKLGLQKSAIAKYESGRVVNIKQATLFRMADILGCSPSLLTGWDSESPSDANSPQGSGVTSEAANLFRLRFEQALSMSGIKPSTLAKRTGISQATLSQYRSGYSTPKKHRMLSLAQELGVSAAWLAGLEETSEPDDQISDSTRNLFATTLTKLRIEHGYTQGDLAAALGIGRSCLGMYESGRREPNLGTVVLISNFFGVTTDRLLGKDHSTLKTPRENPVFRKLISIAAKAPNKDIHVAIAVLKALQEECGEM